MEIIQSWEHYETTIGTVEKKAIAICSRRDGDFSIAEYDDAVYMLGKW